MAVHTHNSIIIRSIVFFWENACFCCPIPLILFEFFLNRVTENILAMARPNEQLIQSKDIIGQFIRYMHIKKVMIRLNILFTWNCVCFLQSRDQNDNQFASSWRTFVLWSTFDFFRLFVLPRNLHGKRKLEH